MPKALDKNSTFKVVLESDKDKEKKPAFVYRYLVGAEQLEFAKLSGKISEAQNPDAIIAGVFETAAKGLVGWENMVDSATGEEVKFDPVGLRSILSMAEAQELVEKVFQRCLIVSVTPIKPKHKKKT